MDLETENRIAAILMKEAAELRRQAEKDGVLAYLKQPQARFRPNSRFLTATVLGVQQANRVVEVNEMWRVRQKELELDDRLKRRSRDDSSRDRSLRDRSTSSEKHAATSSSRRASEDFYSTEEGLKDEEVEEFLQSRVKRGRGTVGSRMDEPGPYLRSQTEEKLPTCSGSVVKEEQQPRILGPEKPTSFKYSSSEEELDHDRHKKTKKMHSKSSRKHRSKENSRERKKKEKKRCKHRE